MGYTAEEGNPGGRYATYGKHGITLNKLVFAGVKRLTSMGLEVTGFPRKPGWGKWMRYTVVDASGASRTKELRYNIEANRWEAR